jgi:SPP1 gp7 family putative phage head morphogenesis protein
MTYWEDRIAGAQTKLSEKNIKQVERQLRKYYQKTMETVIGEFEATYEHLLNSIADEREPTPADLYKLDKYWKMQGQLQGELEKLGSRQVKALSQAFQHNYFEIYYSIALEGLEAYTTLDEAAVAQAINHIWTADGKSWSSRVWTNTNKLREVLNDELVSCIVSGKKTSDLKKMLQERFGVSFSAADSLVRTEMAHIQTQAAKQRYEDYGIQQFEVWADPDERTCEVCGKLHKKIYPVGANPPIPAHPRCRCTIIPVVEE